MAVGFWEVVKPTTDLLIAAPTVGIVSTSWALHLYEIAKTPQTRLQTWKGLPFDVARNQLVRDAQEQGAKHILFLDTDVLPPIDVVRKLMWRHLPIVSGLVWSKARGGGPAAWIKHEGGYKFISNLPSDAIMEVDAIPMGCCLIDMRVFDSIPYPWFNWRISEPGKNIPGQVSEDFDFCESVKEKGFRIFVDTGCRCKHETLLPLDPFGNHEDSDPLTITPG